MLVRVVKRGTPLPRGEGPREVSGTELWMPSMTSDGSPVTAGGLSPRFTDARRPATPPISPSEPGSRQGPDRPAPGGGVRRRRATGRLPAGPRHRRHDRDAGE